MHHIIIQLLVDKELAVSPALLRKWARAALKDQNLKTTEVTLRIVSSEEMAELNSTYRKKQGPTNVLSFPADIPEEIKADLPILGDIVICADVLNREAKEQAKTREAHWAHIVVHGIYHLLGYDHENENDAEKMETLEINTLKKIGFDNPYEFGDGIRHHD